MEPIKIVVKQENQGTALADAKRDVDTLKKSTAGASGANEKAVGDSAKAAVAKAAGHSVQGFSAAGVQRELTTLVREVATGMPSGRTIGALLGQMGIGRILLNPFVAGITAAIGTAAVYVNQQDKDRDLAQTLNEGKAAGQRARDRDAKFADGPTAAASKAMELREKIGAASVHRQQLLNDAESGLFGKTAKAVGSEFFTKGWGWFKPPSARALKAHDDENAQDQEELKKWEEERKQKFAESTAYENEAVKAKANRDMRGARKAEDSAAWWKEYRQQLRLNDGDAAAAIDMADTKDDLRKRERSQLFGGMVNARSGARDVAVAASLAANYSEGGRPNDALIVAQRTLAAINANHQEAVGTATRANFSRPPL